MNINDLQPRVFWHGEMWQVREIDFTSKSLWIENSRRHSVIYEDYENIKIDRPVGMIKDRYGKEVMLYENDLLRIDKKFAEKRDTSFMGGYSIIIWNGQDFGFDFWWEGERLRFMRIMENRDDYDVQLIGNVHENPDLAPEWWRHKNANS